MNSPNSKYLLKSNCNTSKMQCRMILERKVKARNKIHEIKHPLKPTRNEMKSVRERKNRKQVTSRKRAAIIEKPVHVDVLPVTKAWVKLNAPIDYSSTNSSERLINRPKQLKINPFYFEGIAEKDHNLKIVSWCIKGVQRVYGEDFNEYFRLEKPDILCIQQLRCVSENQLPAYLKINGYYGYWNLDGISGVGVLTKHLPLSVTHMTCNQVLDAQKSVQVMHFEKFLLLCVLAPSAGAGLMKLHEKLLWMDALSNYVLHLSRQQKPLIIAGNLNIAHKENDVGNPTYHRVMAGFTDEERDKFDSLLNLNMIDTFRFIHPEQQGIYSCCTSYLGQPRLAAYGWRLDYFLVSKELSDRVKSSVIRHTIKSQEHCPIALLLKM